MNIVVSQWVLNTKWPTSQKNQPFTLIGGQKKKKKKK